MRTIQKINEVVEDVIYYRDRSDVREIGENFRELLADCANIMDEYVAMRKRLGKEEV